MKLKKKKKNSSCVFKAVVMWSIQIYVSHFYCTAIFFRQAKALAKRSCTDRSLYQLSWGTFTEAFFQLQLISSLSNKEEEGSLQCIYYIYYSRNTFTVQNFSDNEETKKIVLCVCVYGAKSIAVHLLTNEYVYSSIFEDNERWNANCCHCVRKVLHGR